MRTTEACEALEGSEEESSCVQRSYERSELEKAGRFPVVAQVYFSTHK